MLIHERFVFLHMPKTGGRFVRANLERELGRLWSPPDCPLNLHHGWDEIPAWASDRPVLVFVRNPWDWYVSWYHFMAREAETILRRPLGPSMVNSLSYWLFVREAAPADPELNDFETVVRRACEMDRSPAASKRIEHGQRLLRREERVNRPVTPEPATPWIPASVVGQQLAQGRDIYSAGLTASLGEGLDSHRLTVGRFESLIDDLGAFLKMVDAPLSRDALARIRVDPSRNSSARGAYRDYYDRKLRGLVATACSDSTERFGYRF